MKKLRVVQWTTGEMGKDMINQVLDRLDLELVGVYVHSAEKDGIDAGTLVHRKPIGVKATSDPNRIFDMRADVVLHSPMYRFDQEPIDRDVCALLASGKNVISNHFGYFWPPGTTPERARKLETACKEGGATLYGAGWNPALIGSQLVPTLTNACSEIRDIYITEFWHFVDLARPEFVFPVTGFGGPPEACSLESDRARSYHAKYAEMTTMLAAILGLTVRKSERNVDVIVADRDFEVAAGTIKKGTVSSLLWSLSLYTDGPTIHYQSRRTIDPEPPPKWELKRVHQIVIEGNPSVRMEVQINRSFLGDVAPIADRASTTRGICAPVVNSIREVVDAPVGFLLPKIFAPWQVRTS